MDFLTLLQKHRLAIDTLGSAVNRDTLRADLAEVRKDNEKYFAMYWTLLLAAFVVTFILAVIFRAEMGGLAVVLGSGGVIQSGMIVLLLKAWKDKTRIDMFSVMMAHLPEDELKALIGKLSAAFTEAAGTKPRPARRSNPTVRT